jgi:hypothetical protein
MQRTSFFLARRWEGLRQQALDRQNSLYEKLMALQRSEMQKLRNWMMETEDKISRYTIYTILSVPIIPQQLAAGPA